MGIFKNNSERAIKRHYRKEVLKALDNIYVSCNNVAYKWGKKAVPLTILGSIINNSKIYYKPEVKSNYKSLQEMEEKFNDLLDDLLQACIQNCKEMKVDEVPLDILKEYKDAIFKGFEEGLKEINNK